MRVLTGERAVLFNGKTYRLHSRTGKVMDTNTRSETEVSGSGGGGGGFSYNGTGGSSTAPALSPRACAACSRARPSASNGATGFSL